ncbi:SDR family NAD(P)-dependent oxidoreductase [Spirillospora sp. NPDC052242]
MTTVIPGGARLVTGGAHLVTGGTKGIGRAIVLGLAESGADVVACYSSDEDAAERLRKELAETGGNHAVVKADVGRAADVEALLEEARTRFGRLDSLIHNAGIISHVPFDKLPDDEWGRVIDTNLTSAFLLAQRALPLLGEGSSLVFVGSKAALVGIPLRAHYTASKSALIGLARSLSKELGPRGIRVNVVAPGIVDTTEPDAEDAADPGMAARLEEYRKRSPLGRLASPAEVAAVAMFLAGPLSSFVTGETVNVDGGL